MRYSRSSRYRRMAQGFFLGWLLISPATVTLPAAAGQMYRWTDDQGRIHLTDTPPTFQTDRQGLKVYIPSVRSLDDESSAATTIEAGRAKLITTKPGGLAVVEARVNQRLTIPLLLDTGAAMSVITKQVATDLRLQGLESLPKLQFTTPGGLVSTPITTLQSLRVGTAEVRHVDVAIDMAGHLPLGLLGMTFLRHFKVTVDHQRGQVTFER